MSDAPSDGRRFGASASRRYVALVLLGMTPVIALAIYAYQLAGRTLEKHIEASNLGATEIARELVERDFTHWVTTLDGFARLPDVVAAVRRRDEEAVRRRLRVLVESKPRVVRAFVTERNGLLWSDYPRAPESLGKRFDYRDWYQGLSRTWTPYVSRVYRRHAEPRPLLVAIAAPVRDAEDGAVIGAVVYQVRLEGLARLLERVEVGEEGYVFLLDHTGVVAAHPRLDLQAYEHADYRSTGPVRAALEGERHSGSYVDPLSGEPMLATAVPCDVQGHTWVAVAQQTESIAYAAISALGWQIGGAGALLALIVGGLCIGLVRSHAQIFAMNRRLEHTNHRLGRENAERVRAEQALQEANEALEQRVEERTRALRRKEEELLHAQKLEAVGLLAGGVAHDFNNLLSVIITYGELILDDLPEDSPLRPDVQEMKDAGERAAALTRQLLAFSRKQVLQPEVVDLNQVVAGMDRMLRRIIREDIDLVTKLGPELDPVKVDAGQIEQIIVNLAVNARDAMEQGGKLTIQTANVELDDDYVRAHPDAQPGPHVMLAITDTGAGMDEETKSRLFEPFYTTKGMGRGTGLGLSTVYGIVKQSGGNIWVYSEVGHGTTFKIYLPVFAGEEPRSTPRVTEPTVPAGTGTVLVVEDEPGIRTLIARVLQSRGYTVLTAGSAEEALEVIADHDGSIHLLLTDVILPGVGGPQLADSIVEHRPDTKVVFMSGYTDDAIVHHGVLEAGTAFVEKPIRPVALLEAVHAALAEDDAK